MRVLLVYPRNPDSFWSFKHILKLVSKQAAFPPLGLLTVAAMLPPSWQLKLVGPESLRSGRTTICGGPILSYSAG